MALRVTSEEVLEVVSDDVPSGTDLTPYITTANTIINQNITIAELEDTELKLIELYLSAHFAILKYKFSIIEYAGGVGANYQTKTDLGFSLTHYGQMAMILDTTGGLSAMNNAIKHGGKIGISWYGEDYYTDE